MSVLELGYEAVERGLIPDALTRAAIRRLCRQRLREARHGPGALAPARAAFLESLCDGPIAPLAEVANQQHYELPPELFALLLGPRRKYSCCYFADHDTTLAAAEEAALRLTCERAGIADGQQILELGCGWGSLSLWMAERYPHSQITAVSNSNSQRRSIAQAAAERGLANLRVVTADMNDFSPWGQTFDRVVSVEMFEHMRNYRLLLERIARWLRPQGALFVHMFCHREHTYPFETEGAGNWMGRHFFSGGVMPSYDLLKQFNRALTVTRQYAWNGGHYQRTAEAWLANLDGRRDEALRIMAVAYGPREARRWLNRWRVFLLAVAELFGFAGGNEWFVAHLLLQHAPASGVSSTPASIETA